jgi:hypothetical protein
MLTIREQILQSIKTELAKITTANGYYTNIGLGAVRGRYDLMPDELPAVVLIPDPDTIISRLDHEVHEMQITVSGFIKSPNSMIEYSERAAHNAEAIQGDIYTCLFSDRITIDFVSGTIEPSVGSTITGSISGATGVIESITLSSGSWALGTAAGTFQIRLPWSDFTTENLLNSGGNTIASTTATITRVDMYSDLLNSLEYQRGGVDPLPDPGEDIVRVPVTFTVTYVILAGNPYKQS